MNDVVFIWSYEHDAWWRANSRGYTKDRAQAGWYTRVEAERICQRANYPAGTIHEVIVELNEQAPRHPDQEPSMGADQ